MRVPLVRELGGNHNDMPVTYAAFRDDVLGKVAHVADRTMQNIQLQTVAVIQMHMHR